MTEGEFALVTQVYDEDSDAYMDVDLCQFVIFDHGYQGREVCGEPAVPGELACEAHLPWL